MTDRTIRTAEAISGLTFDADGLVPVVVQDVATGEVRMVAYQNRDALERTLETGTVHFWSRSRQALWMKGETSGNTLALVDLHADCDADTLLARVRPTGPTCHTGEQSCFGELPGDAESRGTGALEALDRTLAARQAERPEGSYTVRLLDDRNLRLKKLGEETAELVAALATGDSGQAVEEAADLVYHLLAALRAEGVGAEELGRELLARAK